MELRRPLCAVPTTGLMKVALRRVSTFALFAWGAVGLVVLGAVTAVATSDELDFAIGGALIDLGYFVQDPLAPPPASPDALWTALLAHNHAAADVRAAFPRTVHHPEVALVVCMDARIDTNELVGDTRRYFYVLRLAGSVMSEREEEMLELAVDNGVQLVVLTTHTECAAERVAADPQLRARYPSLASGVDEREARRAEFVARPDIAAHLRDGTLRVVTARIDTASGRLLTDE
jgi:carbonic anhydrase